MTWRPASARPVVRQPVTPGSVSGHQPAVASRGRASRRGSARLLAGIGVGPSRLSVVDAGREAFLSVSRAPTRTLLTALGTILAVASVIAIVGLSATASGAVSGTFDVLRATEVTFSDQVAAGPVPVLTLAGEAALTRLRGVAAAGLMWDVNGGGQMPVRRALSQDPGGAGTVQSRVTAVSAAALATMGATVGDGRLFDEGMQGRHARVGLLGVDVARQLGVTGVDRAPTVYLGSTPITVIGIVGETRSSSQVLMSVIIPPTLAEDLALPGARKMIVRTVPGAAQLIAAQGPFALDPRDPARISAEAPPDPDLLRNQVQSSVTFLLVALALVALAVGIVAIANTTLLSVIQRRPEIGLRRSMGAAPRHVAVLILAEAAVTGTIGGVVGDSLGVITVAAVAAVKGWAPVVEPALTLAAPFIGTAAGLLAGAYPAWRASQTTPLAALQR